MSTLFSGIGARLRGGARSPAPPTVEAPSPVEQHSSDLPPRPTTGSAVLPAAPSLTGIGVPSLPPLPVSSATEGISATMDRGLSPTQAARLPLWLDSSYAKHIVKGNFMTLSARPKSVEQGEWMAHHVVEHYRILWNFVRLVYDKEADGTSICNSTKCPKMSAGDNHSYTWLNNRYEPIELPAREYMSLMQRWISGKIDDSSIFTTEPATVSFAQNPSLSEGAAPSTSTVDGNVSGGGDWVGKRSGFPREFANVCRTIFLQMFRVYAHLYWDHFVDPFYHLNLEKQLNSCFSHFLLTATALNMLGAADVEPMQQLIDLWAANGTFPPESRAYVLANVENGRRLVQHSSRS